MAESFWIETLGCPKNQVDSDKIAGSLLSDGMRRADEVKDADLVVVNTCAFIESARQESVDVILGLSEQVKQDMSGGQGISGGQRLVVTGCMAERYGSELAEALPEVDAVMGFGIPVNIGRGNIKKHKVPKMDLLNMARPKSELPWAYVKIAEGCDRSCGYCAIPQFRGPQRSRSSEVICDEVESLQVREAVLIAQDLAAYGRDAAVRNNVREAVRNSVRSGKTGSKYPIISLIYEVAKRVDWVRLLYLYPADLTDELVEAILATGVPYFDLSLQHVSRPLLRRMRRWGDGDRFLSRIQHIRHQAPDAVFRSNFIVGYPGETEEDQEQLLEFIEAAQLDWCAFFAFSSEEGTYAADLSNHVPASLIAERLAELREAQDAITESHRRQLLGEYVRVLVDAPGIARSHREAPEIDGIIHVPAHLPVGEFAEVEVIGSVGPDLEARSVDAGSVDAGSASDQSASDQSACVQSAKVGHAYG